MKNLILLISLSIYFQSAFSKVITVSNTATDIAQFSVLQEAFDAANVNDTVYVHGSPNSYGDATIRRRMVVIGAGYSPKETQFQFSSKIGNLNLDSTGIGGLGGNGDPINGIKLYSLEITGVLNSSNPATMLKKNITIERCKFGYYLYVTGPNWNIINSWINILQINNWNNLVVSNNFIKYVSTTNQPSVIFTNNIFIPNNGNLNSAIGGAISYAIFSYNIFLNNNPTYPELSFCTFNSNIIGNNTQLSAITTINNNTGDLNFNNTNPLFVKMSNPPPTNITDITLDIYDWRLSANSAGKGKGSGGSDIGIYGGNFPMPNLTGSSTIPQITRMDISNSVLPKTEKLKVSFKARKVN